MTRQPNPQGDRAVHGWGLEDALVYARTLYVCMYVCMYVCTHETTFAY
jgi:hypothetical protein